jgi:hypothetical protein
MSTVCNPCSLRTPLLNHDTRAQDIACDCAPVYSTCRNSLGTERAVSSLMLRESHDLTHVLFGVDASAGLRPLYHPRTNSSRPALTDGTNGIDRSNHRRIMEVG